MVDCRLSPKIQRPQWFLILVHYLYEYASVTVTYNMCETCLFIDDEEPFPKVCDF